MAEVPRRKRSLHDIVIEILKAAREGKRKTHIMHEVNLGYLKLEKYLNALKDAGFIAKKSDLWKTTQKGLHVIEACELCIHLAKEIK